MPLETRSAGAKNLLLLGAAIFQMEVTLHGHHTAWISVPQGHLNVILELWTLVQPSQLILFGCCLWSGSSGSRHYAKSIIYIISIFGNP